MLNNWLGANFIPLIIPYSLTCLVLLIGSITDLKTREVPDWINYGFIISGIALNLIFSIVYSNSSYILNSIIGLVIFFGIAYIMFYAGQWGGGDSKILMGIGSMLGLDVSFKEPQFLFWFFINALFIGAIYGLSWSLYLVFKNRNKFWKEYKKILLAKNVIRAKKILLISMILPLVLLFFIKVYSVKILVLSLTFLVILTFYLWIFIKAVEKSSMYKLIEPSKLTEGDWVVKDIFVDKKYICGPKDLGVDKRQIKKLIEFYKNGKIKSILIKEGIPFVPTFLIAFVVTFIFGTPLRVIFLN